MCEIYEKYSKNTLYQNFVIIDEIEYHFGTFFIKAIFVQNDATLNFDNQ